MDTLRVVAAGLKRVPDTSCPGIPQPSTPLARTRACVGVPGTVVSATRTNTATRKRFAIRTLVMKTETTATAYEGTRDCRQRD